MGNQKVMQAVITSRTAPVSNQESIQLCLFDSTGSPLTVGKQVAAQADVAALTQAAITGGESPTEAEFNALRADHAATRTVLNSLLAKMRTAGILAP
jgi:hypothetical protein